jgi:hypothetical protein
LSSTQTPRAAALDATTDAAASSATSRIDCTVSAGLRLDRAGGLRVVPLEVLDVLPDLRVGQVLVRHRDIVVLGGEPRKEERLGRCYR